MLRRLVCLVALSALASADSAATPSRQRYAVISASMLRGGSKNVRWETMTQMTADGKPFSPKADSTATTLSCSDMTGKERKHGEEYERANGHFKYNCNNGNEEVVACVGSDRANKARIDVGKTLDVDGFWHKCEHFENGSTVYTQENSCRDASGKEIHIGDEFSVANLRFACDDGTYKVVGCSYKAEDGQLTPLSGGEERREGKLTHKCDATDDTFQFSTRGAGCSRRGKEYAEGDKFQENHLNYECSGGTLDITGCYISESRDLAIGKDVAEDGMLHRCYRLGSSVEYMERQCSGAACTPPPVEDVPNEVPALGRGLKSPGVSSFSVSSNLTPAKGLKLDFDKLKMEQQ